MTDLSITLSGDMEMSKTWLLCIACAISLTVQGQSRNRPGTDADARAASGRDAALTANAAVADAMFAAATKLLASVRGDPEFNEALRQFSMEDEAAVADRRSGAPRLVVLAARACRLEDRPDAREAPRAAPRPALDRAQRRRLSQGAEHHAARVRAATGFHDRLPARHRGIHDHAVRRAFGHGTVGLAVRGSSRIAERVDRRPASGSP